MKVQSRIGWLAGLELLFSIGYLVSRLELESELPVALQAYFATKADIPVEVVVAGFVILALHVIALLALLFASAAVQRGWGRLLFLWTVLPLLLVCLMLGPNVVHALAYTFDLFSVLVMGMLVTVLWREAG